MKFPHVITTEMVRNDMIRVIREVAEDNGMRFTINTNIISSAVVYQEIIGDQSDNPFDLVHSKDRVILRMNNSSLTEELGMKDDILQSEETYLARLEEFRADITRKIQGV